MPKSRFPLLFIADVAQAQKYSSGSGGSGRELPNRNRASHGARIQAKLEATWKSFGTDAEERRAVGLPTRGGIYVDFKGLLGFDLAIKSLESLRKGIRLTSVRIVEEEVNGEVDQVTIATVFIPSGEEGFFIEKISDYLNPDKDLGENKPKNKKLIAGIEDISLAVLESFWQDRSAPLPGEDAEWCEVWVRHDKWSQDSKEKLYAYCDKYGVEYLVEEIIFPERLVLLVKANREQLTELLKSYDYLAEIRKAREPMNFLNTASNAEQADWAQDLLDRMEVSTDINTSVLVLDTGVNRGHRLLGPVLDEVDCHSYDDEWGKNDHDGHGTGMAGLSIFGDLYDLIHAKSSFEIGHRLESGKILPPKGENEKHLYGSITAQVISKAETINPDLNRIICITSSEDDDNQGYPSSWSGEIDALASGYMDDYQRLFVIAAGNIRDQNLWADYPNSGLTAGIHSPGQAWNALVVGAYTQRVGPLDPTLPYTIIAPHQGLSPFSSTSTVWDKKWPLKPDIVMEGGNAAVDGYGLSSVFDEITILTTAAEINKRQFDMTWATSAATAKAAHLCALIQTRYPNAWAETVRGLMVHSAEWTQALREHFWVGGTERKQYENLVKACGYGVPNPVKALYCSENVLTLIAQESIQPFAKNDKGNDVTNDMHFYELPWPTGLLESLGSTEVTIKVTLSYFVEPGPGEIGWKDRYRYRSHGLKFDVNNYTESRDEFVARINHFVRTEGEEYDLPNDSARWLIGSDVRHRGSIHSDSITASASQIAACKYISVFPSIGWWKQRTNQKRLDRETRYSLIVTLETPAIEVDLYTEVATQIGVGVVTL